MKFRTDFVTNSSDSSFLAFNIKNKRLFDFLTNLGIKITDTEDGELCYGMTFTLPTGESQCICSDEDWSLPHPDKDISLSAWVMSVILGDIERGDEMIGVEDEEDPEWIDEEMLFRKKLIDLFNEAGITNLDWAMVENWSRDEVMYGLDAVVGDMDGDITSAVVEYNYGFEGEIGPLDYMEVYNGNRMYITADVDDFDNEFLWNEDEEDSDADESSGERGRCQGLKFVITGKLEQFANREELVEYIESEGGTVSESVSKNTHFLICNDLTSTSSKMKKAESLCVPIITENAFLYRYGDRSLVEMPEDDPFELTYEGGFYEFFQQTGIGKTTMQVWKKGKWVNK